MAGARRRGARHAAVRRMALAAAAAAAAIALGALSGAGGRQRPRQRAKGGSDKSNGSGKRAPASASASADDCVCEIYDAAGSAKLNGQHAAAEAAASTSAGALAARLLGQLAALAPSALPAPPLPAGAHAFVQQLRHLWLVPTAGDEARAHAAPRDPPAIDLETLEALRGEWTKDFRRCEPMDEFFSLFGVGPILRRGARLMRGVRIDVAGGALTVTQLCALRWLSAAEEFPLARGAAGEHRRRDLRRGRQRGVLARADGGVVRLELSWGDPLAGGAVDELRLVRRSGSGNGSGGGNSGGGGGGGQAAGRPVSAAGAAAAAARAGDELHVTSSAWVGGRKARFKWVCVRKGGGA